LLDNYLIVGGRVLFPQSEEWELISKINSPPFIILLWDIHAWLNGFPLSVADFI